MLSTLPERERRSGLGEIAKCWLLEGRALESLTDRARSVELIEMSVALKARLVGGDEREGATSGPAQLRPHPRARAREDRAAARPDELRHGEAVAIGLAFAARLARALERVGDDVVAYHDEVLDVLGLDGTSPGGSYDTEELLEAMTFDKKARHDLSFVLAGPGGYELVSRRRARRWWVRCCDQFKGER